MLYSAILGIDSLTDPVCSILPELVRVFLLR